MGGAVKRCQSSEPPRCTSFAVNVCTRHRLHKYVMNLMSLQQPEQWDYQQKNGLIILKPQHAQTVKASQFQSSRTRKAIDVTCKVCRPQSHLKQPGHLEEKVITQHHTTRSKCRYKSWRPNSLPTDFRSFVGTDRKSVSVPPAGLFGHERCGETLRNRG